MRAFLLYLKYVVVHKWFVFWECRRLGLGLRQSLRHDNSKFSRQEFGPYMDHWTKNLRDPERIRAYRAAWLHHIAVNPHHWNYWVDARGRAAEMPDEFVREMVADWRGVGMALGKGRENAVHWYLQNIEALVLHPKTRFRVEVLLGLKG